MRKAAFCISLDFEKFWGIHDLPGASNQIDKFTNVDVVVDGILALFEKYQIRATWATVGLLNHGSIEELKDQLNTLTYPYQNASLNPRSKVSVVREEHGKSILAKEALIKIGQSTGQEIASHTFSHFYCLEKGIDVSDFEHDLQASLENFKQPIRSIVFPRNQVDEDCLNSCMQKGIKVYRGAQESWFWKTSPFEQESKFKKAFRTLEAYLPIYSNSISSYDMILKDRNLLNVPGNRFLRPISQNTKLERLKLKRVKSGMLKAVKSNGVYHLWWHPHNFAHNIEGSLDQLEELLNYFKLLELKFGMQSLNMGDFSDEK